MATIIVEGVPDGLLARLRLAAAGSGRSLSREVVVQLVRTAGCEREGTDAVAKPGPWCAAAGTCPRTARRVEARATGWGGPPAW